MNEKAVKNLLRGLADIKVVEEDSQETQTLAKAFKEGEGTPLAKAWEKILKMCLMAHAWEATHMPESLTGTARADKITFLNGRVAQIEALMGLPGTYNEIAKNAEESSKVKAQSSK